MYHLMLLVRRATSLQIGRLGRFSFPHGCYVYTGSAMNGLERRIARHSRKRKTLHWHVDYLLRRAELIEALLIPTRRRIECERNLRVLALPGARIVAPGFGSGGCRCPSHLAYLGPLPESGCRLLLKLLQPSAGAREV